MVDGQERWISRSVAAVTYVFTKIDGEVYILANKRGKGLPNNVGKWNCPSGFLDYDETIEQCATREVFEETGVNIRQNQLHLLEVDTDPKRSGQVVLFRYWAVYNGDPDVLTAEHSEPNEVDEIKWIKMSEIGDYDWTSEAHVNGIKNALSSWGIWGF